MISQTANRSVVGDHLSLDSPAGLSQEACGRTTPQRPRRAPRAPRLSTAVLRKYIRLNHMTLPFWKGGKLLKMDSFMRFS